MIRRRPRPVVASEPTMSRPIMSRPIMSRRISRGFTLIELILVLSLMGSLLGGTIGLLSLVQNSNEHGRRDFLCRQELRRFANDVRRDMHAAAHVEINETALVITSESPPSEVTFEVNDGTLARRKTSNADNTADAQDRYRIKGDVNAAIEWVEQGVSIRWTITPLDRPANPVGIVASRRPSR